MVKVETLKPVRLNGRDIAEGQLVEVEDSLVQIWISKGFAKIPHQENQKPDGDNKPDYPQTLEDFESLSASEQKALLKKLGIEGDDSNEEKRTALYAGFLTGGENNGKEAEDTDETDNLSSR